MTFAKGHDEQPTLNARRQAEWRARHPDLNRLYQTRKPSYRSTTGESLGLGRPMTRSEVGAYSMSRRWAGPGPPPRPRLVGRAAVPPIVALIDRFNAQVDEELRALAARGRADPEPTVVACQRGCAACCTFAVGTTTPEALRVAVAVEAMPKAVKAETLERLAAWEREWAIFERAHGDDATLWRVPIERVFERRDVHWNARRKACPFLDLATHACRVYEARPTACRTHHACHVPPRARGVPSPTTGDVPNDPGEGCFTTAADVAKGRPPCIWQLSNTVMEKAGAAMVATLGQHGVPVGPTMLAPGVAKIGRELFHWRTQARRSVPTLRSTWPRGGRPKEDEA